MTSFPSCKTTLSPKCQQHRIYSIYEIFIVFCSHNDGDAELSRHISHRARQSYFQTFQKARNEHFRLIKACRNITESAARLV